jgi:hypothetical protein
MNAATWILLFAVILVAWRPMPATSVHADRRLTDP